MIRLRGRLASFTICFNFLIVRLGHRDEEFAAFWCPNPSEDCSGRRASGAGFHNMLVYNASMPFRDHPASANAKRGRTPPPEDTFEEASFLKMLGEKQKAVSVKLLDGQVIQGWIEYYDKHMIRLTREGAPNLFIYKHEIVYIAEDSGKKK